VKPSPPDGSFVIDGVLELELPRSDALAAAPGALPSFIAGPENALLVEPLRRLLFGECLAEAARLFNPLVLVGPTGSGKSQLARGVVRHWRDMLQRPDQAAGAVEYFTAADFGRQCQNAAEENRLGDWRSHVRSLQIFVLEDLQQLRPSGVIQEELRYAIDAILEEDGVIVVTAQREPAMLKSLEAGLRNRLAAGLTVRVQPPGLAARRAILQLAAHSRGTMLDNSGLSKLAHRDGSPSELVGRLQNPSGLLPLVERGEANTDTDHMTAEGEHDDRATLKQIIAIAARYFNVTQAALTGPSRRTSLVHARNIIVHLARRLTSLSYAEIGRALGGRDHTTIMHADRRLVAQLVDDLVTQQAIDELDRLLR
jgi:chromosomal replication initiator protein